MPAVEVQAPAPGSMEAIVRLKESHRRHWQDHRKVNGRELPAATRSASPDPNALSAKLELNLEGATLSPTGKNVIEVFAENGDGVIRSRGATAVWEPSRSSKPPDPGCSRL